jgi:hypothetical protein
MDFYKRKVNITDFQKVTNTGQTNFEFLLDEKISFQIMITQNIEDIGFYESDEKIKSFHLDGFSVSEFNIKGT